MGERCGAEVASAGVGVAVRGGPGDGYFADHPLGAGDSVVSRWTKSRQATSSGQALESLTATVRVFLGHHRADL